jgi:cardiolipin synthase
MPPSLIRIVPNVLSSLRLALALVFPAIPPQWWLPAVIAGGVSDWIDGVIARRYQATSAAGALLDAIADKLLTLSVLVTLLSSGRVLWWQVAAVLCRDVVVAMIALYALSIRRYDGFRHMRPRLPGKLATSVMFIWLVAMLAGAPANANSVLLALAAAVSAVAGADYLVQFLMRPAELRGRGGRRPDFDTETRSEGTEPWNER